MRIPVKLNKYLVITIFCIIASRSDSYAYSVLTHEAIVDASWQQSLLPLLKLKYPGTTDSALTEAHGFAYGGAIAPDMGYFPFGSKFFTNLVHYVRSGDFVNVLLDEAKDVNEYAFALGFMCHYMADMHGHFLATNRAVPIVYPKLMKKYGKVVTYEEDKTSHKRIEFSFDVLQVANGNYATKAYHDFIGFHVSRSLLERAFLKTYGLDINKVFGSLSLSIEAFRFSVKNLFPALTRSAWVIKKKEILKLQPTASSRSFKFKMNRRNYYHQFGKKQEKPGVIATSFGWLIRVLPKLGPLKSLKLKAPGPQAEKLFIQSFDTTLLYVADAMKTLRTGTFHFTNIDIDTGNKTARGEYKMADVNYCKLLLNLRDDKFEYLTTSLKQNIISFYSVQDTVLIYKEKSKDLRKVNSALEELKIKKPL